MHSSKHTKHFIYPRRDAWFLLPGFLGFALWYLVPFGMSLAASVMENSANARFAGLANYAAVLQSSYFRLGFGNTLRFFAVAVVLSLVIGFLLANMIFWHSRRRISWLTLVLLIPIFLPTAAIVPLWKVMMGGRKGGSVACTWAMPVKLSHGSADMGQQLAGLPGLARTPLISL